MKFFDRLFGRTRVAEVIEKQSAPPIAVSKGPQLCGSLSGGTAHGGHSHALQNVGCLNVGSDSLYCAATSGHPSGGADTSG